MPPKVQWALLATGNISSTMPKHGKLENCGASYHFWTRETEFDKVRYWSSAGGDGAHGSECLFLYHLSSLSIASPHTPTGKCSNCENQSSIITTEFDHLSQADYISFERQSSSGDSLKVSESLAVLKRKNIGHAPRKCKSLWHRC